MYRKHKSIKFPEAKGININMMPIIFGDMDSIPDDVKQYKDIIDSCDFKKGAVVYLTITETYVKKGECQRRPGIHVESPEGLMWGGGAWGGSSHKKGIYMASSDGMCNIWSEYKNGEDKFGGCSVNSVPHKMKKNELYWLTDKTPHENIPAEKSGYRQYFRLVSDEVDVWYSKHSTINPKGVKPNCIILDEDKFLV